MTAAYLEANRDRLEEADDATLEAELGAHLVAAEAARLERKRAYDFQKSSKEYRERKGKDAINTAQRKRRKTAAGQLKAAVHACYDSASRLFGKGSTHHKRIPNKESKEC